MKEGIKETGTFLVMILLVIVILGLFQTTSTGLSISVNTEANSMGPSAEEQACLETCAAEGCQEGDRTCMMVNSQKCEAQCGASKPQDQSQEEQCVESCVLQGCDNFDFNCQQAKKSKCDQQCGMAGEPEAQSDEEQCIRDCVAKVDPNIICSSGTEYGEGETGNEVCQRCANECGYLYEGPCLDDDEITAKEEVCYDQCEHCYGEQVMGDSGAGYECIIDIKCADASGEFGDGAGTGPGIGEEGYVNQENIMEKVFNWIGDLFG